MSLNMIFVIPSYNRAHVLKTKTLSLLDRFHIPYTKIHVFLVDDPIEREAYAYVMDMGLHVHFGPKGLHHMRNHISKTFPAGTRMVCLDDDIDDLVYMREDTSINDIKSAKRYPLLQYPTTQFVTWLEDTFAWMEDHDVHLFGIYPVKNGYFMKSLPPITTDLRFCVGAFWGCINQPDVQLMLEEKEDVERTLKFYVRDRSVLRFNHIAPVTKYYKTNGGMQANGVDRKSAAKHSAEKIVATFPDLSYLYTGKKSGVIEVKFKNSSAVSCQTHKTKHLRWRPLEDPLRMNL